MFYKAKSISKKIFRTYSFISEYNITTIATSWSFFFLLAVVPLFFLLLSALKIFGANLSFIYNGLPVEFVSVLTIIGDLAENGLKGATLFFTITVLYSASILFNHMLKDVEYIYLKKRKNNGIIRKILSFLVLIVTFFTFILFAGLLVLSSKITSLLPQGKFYGITSKLIINSFAILFIYGIIVLLNLFLSPKKLKFNQLLIGSGVSLIILVLGTCGFSLYVKFFARYTNLYGSLSVVIVFLLWLYIIMLGLVIGTVTIKLLDDKKISIQNEDLFGVR